MDIEKSIGPVGMERMADSGIATMTPPSKRIIRRSTREIYAGRANRIVVRHHLETHPESHFLGLQSVGLG